MIARARLWHLVIAVLVVAALLLQVWIAIQAAASPPSHDVGVVRGTAVGWRIGRVFSFFTVQSNVLSGVVSAALVANAARDGRGFRILRLNALFGITVTGIVYSTVLAKVHEPHGWQETSSNAVVHYVVPIMMVLGWLIFGPRPRVTPSVIGLAMIWPAVYLAYILIIGSISKWYPYPFLDVGGQGYGRVLINSVGVVLVFAAVSLLIGWGDRRLPPAPAGQAQAD
jgi:hypothetical protein